MCLIFIAYRHHSRYPLVVAANRDEFYARPTAPARFWTEHPELLAGRDLESGGSWLGLTRSGRFAAVTNYREAGKAHDNAPSRGHLVTDYLLGADPPAEYLRRVSVCGAEYNGFNLLAGDAKSLCWYSNRANGVKTLTPGVYALSNHLLDTRWPKVERGKAGFESLLGGKTLDETRILDLLADRAVAVEEELPDTGVGREWERVLSPIFINSDNYGTRSSTVISLDEVGGARFLERSYDSDGGERNTVEFEFSLETRGSGDRDSRTSAGPQPAGEVG